MSYTVIWESNATNPEHKIFVKIHSTYYNQCNILLKGLNGNRLYSVFISYAQALTTFIFIVTF